MKKLKMKDETKVSIVAAICVMALAVIFKNVLHISSDQTFIPMISPVILFMVYSWSKDAKCKYNTANIWMVIIVMVTIAIITLYAI